MGKPTDSGKEPMNACMNIAQKNSHPDKTAQDTDIREDAIDEMLP